MTGSSLKIGRVFGIDIRIDYSWLFIFVLVTWNLGTTFGSAHPSWGRVLAWGTALSASLLFFGSVLAHELAHSVVAKAQGVPVRNITLFLFGGVSNIQREPDSAGHEFLMAIVGPLTSIVIGLALLFVGQGITGPLGDALANPSDVLSRMSPLATLLVWLGSINLTLGLFNLIPGFPLDGGRVLRSILWALTRNLQMATRWAAGVGQAIAWLMIIGGVAMVFGARIPFFGTGFVSGLWLAFIGWFLNSASAQSYQQLVVHDILEGIPVSRMMRPNPPTVTSDLSVSNLVADYLLGKDDHAFPVIDNGGLAGLVCLHDVRLVNHSAWNTTKVSGIMTPISKLVVTSPDEDAAKALNKLMQRDVGQLPVVQDGRLVGLLRRQDIISWLQAHAQANTGGRQTIPPQPA